MTNTQSSMKKWIKLFKILSYIAVIILGFGVAGCGIGLIVFAFNKSILSYKIDDTTTVLDLFKDLSISSRAEIVAVLSYTLVYITINFILIMLILKWLKSLDKTLEPFSNDSICFMRKTSKFIYIASIIGFLFESIILSFVNSDALVGSDYFSIIIVGFVIHFLSHIFAYANERKSKNNDDTDSQVIDVE